MKHQVQQIGRGCIESRAPIQLPRAERRVHWQDVTLVAVGIAALLGGQIFQPQIAALLASGTYIPAEVFKPAVDFTSKVAGIGTMAVGLGQAFRHVN